MKPEEKIVHAIISSFNALNWLREAKHTGIIKQAEKKLLGRTIDSLMKYESLYDLMEREAEKPLEDCYNAYFDHLKDLADVKIYEIDDLRLIKEAYRKDPKSIMGITKKILR